jgi:hypothetical protein
MQTRPSCLESLPASPAPALSPPVRPCRRRFFGSLAAHGAALIALGCASDGATQSPEVWVDIGLPGGEDGLEFVPLEPGAAIPLETFGQGGTHALLAVRTSGLGNRAFVGVTITNAATGDAVSAPPGPSPRLLICRSPDVCDLLPLLVMTGGLVPPGTDRDGLNVHLRVEAANSEGTSASAERDAVLSTEQL